MNSSSLESAVRLLREIPGLDPDTREVARFLLAGDLLDLGLSGRSAEIYEELSGTPWLAAAAFVGLTRARTGAGDFEDLYRDGREAPVDAMKAEDLAEVAWRVARAAFETGRYPTARAWARRVPAESGYAPYAKTLEAQIGFALGRYGDAVEAAGVVLTRNVDDVIDARLRDRATVLLAEMLIEIGLYDHARALLDWADLDDRLAGRADRAADVAGLLASFDSDVSGDSGRSVDIDALVDDLGKRFDALETDLEAAVATPAERQRRIEDLRRVWPSERQRARRREWTARRALEGWRAFEGWTIGRALGVLWKSLPPVLVWELVTREEAAGASEVTAGPKTRFFLDPDPALTRSLAALALVDARPPSTGGERSPEGCIAGASETIRRLAAGRLAEGSEPPLDALATSARGCGADLPQDPEAAVVEAADRALLQQANRLRDEMRKSRYVLEDAIARARLHHLETIRNEKANR